MATGYIFARYIRNVITLLLTSDQMKRSTGMRFKCPFIYLLNFKIMSGNLIVKDTKGGISIKRKSGTMARRIANDESFERTREINAEFARAGTAAGVFVDAFRSILARHVARDAQHRLLKLFTKVIQEDAVNEHGQRTVAGGSLDELKRFNFNSAKIFSRGVVPNQAASIDRATGIMKVDFPDISLNSLQKPNSATHLRLMIGGADIDFEKEYVYNAFAATDYILIGKEPAPIPASTLSVNLPAGSEHPQFLIAAIQFFKLEHGKMSPLRNRSHDAAQLVAASGRP